MPKSRRRRVKVFVDSSVLVAATLSPTGGSFRMLKEADRGLFDIVVNRYVLGEVVEVLARKYPEALPNFHEILETIPFVIKQNPPTSALTKYLYLIESEDTPILAGAARVKVDFLITLDKDFRVPKISKARLPFRILTPGEFFKNHWKK